MRRAPVPLSFFLHKEWNVDARAEAEQPFCTRRWSHTPGTGTGTAEQGDLQSLRHRTPWAAWTCRSSSTEPPVAAAAPTSPPATLSPPASKDGLSFIPNVQHHSDRLICPWALSGLTGGHWWHQTLAGREEILPSCQPPSGGPGRDIPNPPPEASPGVSVPRSLAQRATGGLLVLPLVRTLQTQCPHLTGAAAEMKQEA